MEEEMSMGSELSATVCDDCEKATATRRRGVLRLCDCCYRGGPLTVAPRIVVATPVQAPQDAPKAVEAAPDMPRVFDAPVARLRLATVSVVVKPLKEAPVPRPKRAMVVAAVVPARVCRIEGCGCRVRKRGLCDGCARQATAEGVFEAVAAPIQRYDTARAVADVVNVASRNPGLSAQEISLTLDRTHHQTRAACYAAVEAGKLVRKGDGYYLPDVAANATDAEERQAAIVALVTGQWRTKPEICAELGYDKHEAAYALGVLRVSGRLIWDGAPGAGWTVPGARLPPVRTDTLAVMAERIIGVLRVMPRTRPELCKALAIDGVTLTRAAGTRRAREAIDRSGDKWKLLG